MFEKNIKNSLENNLANIFHNQNLKLLTAISEKYNIEKSDLFNEFLFSAEQFKNNMKSDLTIDNNLKKNNSEKQNQYKIIEYNDNEFLWNTSTGYIYEKHNVKISIGKINNLGELMLYDEFVE